MDSAAPFQLLYRKYSTSLDDYFKLTCVCRDNTETYHIEYIVVSMVQWTCVLALLVIYSWICVEICKHQRFQRDHAGIRLEKYKQGKRGLLTSVCVIVSYVTLAVPHEVYKLLEVSLQYDSMLDGIFVLLI